MISANSLACLMSIGLLLVTQFSPVLSDDLIDTTCKHTPHRELCKSSARSNPKNRPTDSVSNIALIIVDVLALNSTAALKLIPEIPGPERPLHICKNAFSNILTVDVPEAVEALTKGAPKFAQDAVRDSARQADYCQNLLAANSPLIPSTTAGKQLSDVANAIIQMLLLPN